MEYVLLLIGFLLLIKRADFFVDGSSSLARILKIPSVIIGLTIVAMGTSAPEASVSINAALAGSAVLLYLFAKSKRQMARWEGATCIILYIIYTVYLLIRV